MSAKRSYHLYVSDILRAMDVIEQYTAGITFEDFVKDQKTIDAVVWNVTVMGEASKRISRPLRQRYKDLPWADMAKMRDKISHAYFGINHEIVWNVIKERLPKIKPAFQIMLQDLAGDRLFPE